MIKLLDVLSTLPELSADKNVCISISGGLDSTVLLYLLVQKYGADRVKTISFNYGQRHSVELDMVKKTVENIKVQHIIINLSYLKDISKSICSLISDSDLKPKTAQENAGDPQVNTYVPFRNAQFAYITAAYAESHNCQYIFQGLNEVDTYGYWDTTKEFIDSINNTLSLNRKNTISIVAPFVELKKEDELIIAKELSNNFGYDILQYTWSCYNGVVDEDVRECAVCNTCQEKLKGYILAEYGDDVIISKFKITQGDIIKLKNEYKG